MVFQNDIIAGASGAGGVYTIDQSVRFDRPDTSYMSWTPGVAPTSRRIYTFSWWIKRTQLGVAGSHGHYLFGTAGFGFFINFTPNHQISIYTTGGTLNTNAVFRDMSAWYHIVLAIDTTQATAADRLKLYVNKVEQTFIGSAYPAQNSDQNLGQGVAQFLGFSSTNQPFDGYMAEVIVVDGQQLTPSDFGEYNRDGVWVPKAYAGTYGTNGFYLDFADSGSLGTDVSGNGNDFTPSGITSDDQVADTPTTNSCTMNFLDNGGAGGNVILSDGNLVATATSSASYQSCRGTLAMTTGKWYWEMAYTSGGSRDQRMSPGICDNTAPIYYAYERRTAHIEGYTGIAYYKDESASTVDSGTYVTFGNGDHIMFAFDADAGKLWFGKNGTWMGSPAGDPAAGTNASLESIPTGESWQPLFTGWYSNQGTFYFLEDTWTYTAPTGFNALNTANLPTPAIADGSAYFQTTLYTGNSSDGHEINQSGNSTFSPGLVWIKDRIAANQHHLFDQVRGVYKRLTIRLASEDTLTDQLVSFNSDGFTLDDDNSTKAINRGNNYVAWQWAADGTSGSSNSDGSITSTASVNTTSGFSIVGYTGNATSGATVGHGLGLAPDVIIVKNRDASDAWQVYHSGVASDAETDYLVLNTTAAVADNVNRWNDTAPTSSVFSLGNAVEVNTNTEDYIAYVFAEVEGFSKFGAYTGNGNANGSFVWCGLRPAWVMIKRTNSTSNWTIFDNQREGYNVDNDRLRANTLDTETTTDYVDILSNGFKLRSSDADVNASSGTYIFMAFAEHPFGGSGVAPVPAR